MDKKRMKPEKEEFQNNERRKEAEMFVLPPDILEKLGINLGQFTSPLQHPGTSHAPEASKAKCNKNTINAISNSVANNGDLTTKSKRKTANIFTSTGIPNIDNNINKSDEFNDHSLLQKLLQSDAVFPNTSFKTVSADQENNLMSTSEATQANKCSSSILETASLMKKSVLLSPTFCNTDFNPNTCDQISELKESTVVPVTLICTRNVNKCSETPTDADAQPPSYVEIWTSDVNINEEPKQDNNDLDRKVAETSLHESTSAIDSAPWSTRYPETFAALSRPSQNTNNINIINSGDSNIETNKMAEEFAVSTKYHESNINNNFIRSTVLGDCDDSQNSVISTVADNFDEIYSSDASNQENKSKIKIISEQVLNPVQLKEIQNACASHKTSFMPVSVETLIRNTPEPGELIHHSSMYAKNELKESGNKCNELNDNDESNDVKTMRNFPEIAGKTLPISDGDGNKVKQITTPNNLICDSKQSIKSKTETQKTSSKKRKSLNQSIPDVNSSCIDKVHHGSTNKNTVAKDKLKEVATCSESNGINATRNFTSNTTSNNLICDSKQSIKSKTETRKTSSKKRRSLNESIPDLNSSCIDKEDYSSTNKTTVAKNKVKEIATYLESNDMKATRNVTKTSDITTPNDLIRYAKQSKKSKTEARKISKSKSLNESIPDLNSSCTDKADHSGNNNKTVDEEKVKEIATYLVQLLNDRNKQHKKVDSDKKIYKCYKRHPLKAKLVSHGVEKPGGKNEIKRNLVNETKLLLQESLNCNNMDSWISTDDIICIGTTSETHELTQKLCVCVDFGKLDFYNWDDYYENIHFWYHKKDVCEPELCYSIYNEGEVSRYTEDDIQILDIPRVLATGVLINNTKSIQESKVIYEDTSSSNNIVDIPAAKKPGKRGRPKKITKEKSEKLDDSDTLINSSKSFEESALKLTCVDGSLTPSKNTSVAEQPAKRGRGRPKKISTQTKTDSTIHDEPLSSTDKHNTDNNPCQRLSSTSSSDEPLITKRAKIASIKTQQVKKEQNEYVQSECEVSYDVCIEKSSISNNDLKCAICKEEVTNKNWFEHIKKHNYLAWRNTEPALDLDDEYEVIRHLISISKEQGTLICSKCQKQYKTPKSYYGHVQNCGGGVLKINTSIASDLDKTQESLIDKDTTKTRQRRKRITADEIVECGVCNENVKNVDWIEHIRVKHNYMAKRAGEIALNENDEEEVKEHLYNICKYNDGLICNKCGQKRKYLKTYFSHLEACKGLVEVKEPEIVKVDIDCNEIVKCGVCKLDVYGKLWIDHIQRVHKYLAWIEGEPPLDLDNPNQVQDHLQNIIKTVGFLRCWVCSETRKIVKIFLQHVNLCELSGFEKFERVEKNPNVGKDQFECGVCHEIGFESQWKKHAMLKHYNIAWMVGQIPINLRNPYAVEKYLKEYKLNNKNSLVCKVCGETRVSCYGFYAHIMICGKSEAELEELHNVCEICNKKYVCIYKNQHMASHRDSEMRKEKRERDAAKQMESDRRKELEEVFEPGRKRKAAERASQVIQDLKQEDDEGPPAKRSRCDSEDSVKIEETNEGESSDDDVDSDVSNEALIAEEPKRDRIRKKPQIISKIPRMPFKVGHFSTYVRSSYKDFCDYHFTDDCLFKDWRHADIEFVSESVSKYLPSVTESCYIKYGDNKWTSYKRFKAAKITQGFVLYTGGCIQCLSWAPQPTNIDEDFYFAVSTHRGPDRPRFGKDSTPVHPGLIQIWSMTDFGVLPEFSLGLVHDYGTIWAMDWCPSGARDVLPDREQNSTKYRLGLLAVACSNGFAYVLSVPYPDVNQSEMTICKATPVAELRLNMNCNKDIYQATSITWSTQKGHSVIVVGYADGTTALYDLSTKSPLLTKKENNITIFYPFQDKRTGNGPISGVSVTPSMESSRSVGGVCAGGSGGATAWSARRGATHSTMLSATGVASTPLWPSYLLYSEVAVSSKVVNELEWVGGGRRAGSAFASGVCARCASAVLAAPPVLRLVRAHPCYPEPRRPLSLATLRMVPLNEKPRIKTNELAMVIEPLTYEDTVSKYGLELKMTLKNKNPSKLPNELEQRPERFPLSDVTAISFCPSDRYHNRVAIGSHCGLVFILNAD